MFSSGLVIKAKTSLSNPVGMGSSIQVDDLDKIFWAVALFLHLQKFWGTPPTKTQYILYI